jgi:pimeloyl-ACP methyl ester carboxylesterase
MLAKSDRATASLVHPKHPSDPPLRRDILDGRAITWVEGGPRDGPCVVMVHGLPGSHRDFRWLAPPLEHMGLRVIRLDMPGFGGTELTPPQLPVLSAHLLRRLDHLELERVVLLGHSFGGPPALVAASRDPGRIRGLALLSSVGLRPHKGLRNFKGLPTLNRGLRLPLVRRPLIRALQVAYHRAGFPKRTPGEQIRRSLEVIGAVDFALIHTAARALRASTLIGFCEDDHLVEPAIGEQLGYVCPSGPRLRFASGGHNPQKAWACELAEALEPWARECLRPRALPPVRE